MAKFIFALNQSLDGYVDHLAFAPAPQMFQHFIEDMRGLSGLVHGRLMYETMRYWDEDQPDWDVQDHDFAAAWRSKPKWVVSRSLTSVGPNATPVTEGLEAAMHRLKTDIAGDIEVAGPQLAGGLTRLGLIDEYHLYVHPVVLGQGKPLFNGPVPRLRLKANDVIANDVIRLIYVPA